MTRQFVMTPFLALGLAVPFDTLTWRQPKAQIMPPIKRSAVANRRLYGKYVIQAAKKYQLDPKLLFAVITIESGWQTEAVSENGAMGLMQLMPDTARQYGVKNAFNPQQNIFGGARYLRYLLKLFNNDVRLALAAYNSGQGRVLKSKGIPNIRQTQQYVKLVMETYKPVDDFTDQPRLFFQ